MSLGMSFGPADWLLTYFAHSTVLLAAAWLVSRMISEQRLVLREAIWRLALVGGLITASLQLATGIEAATGSWSLATSDGQARAEAVRETPQLPSSTTESTAGPSLRLDPPPAATLLADSPPARALGSSSWRSWLTSLWALGATTLLALLAVSYLRFRRRLHDRRDLEREALRTTLRRLELAALEESIEMGPVRLTTTGNISVALARGVRRGEICLPEETLDRFPIERHEIVLAHELAHLHRRDPLWFALTRILERALFFQPLNGLARRQLQELSEFRCDDWAVHVTRRPISLAKTLTEVAELSLGSKTTVLAPTLAANQTHLGRRVARLLKRSYPMPSDQLPRWTIPAAVLLLGLTAWIAPSIRASASPALHPGEPAIASPAPLAPLAPKSAPDASATPTPRSAPTPPMPVTPPTAPSPMGSLVPRVVPAPPAPSGAPAPPTPPARERAHLHEDGCVLPGDDLELALDSVAVIAEGLGADLTAVIADAAVLAPSVDAVGHAMLAAEISTEWMDGLDFNTERLEALREMSERLERAGYASEAQTARLAEMTERLIESAEPSAEKLSELRERAVEMAELRHEALDRHRELAREFDESHREEMERLRVETRRLFGERSAERRELIERSRRAREEALLGLEREGYSEIREEMLRMQRELSEQLRELNHELYRDGGEDREGTADRADENKQ